MTRQEAAIVALACQLAKATRANNVAAVHQTSAYLVSVAETYPAEKLAKLEAMFLPAAPESVEAKESGNG